MIKRLLAGSSVFALLIGQVAFAASYTVDVTAKSSAALEVPVGEHTSHDFEIKNTGTQDDTYHVTVFSENSWIANERDFPKAVSIAAGKTATVSVEVLVPGSTALSTRGKIELTAKSNTSADPVVLDTATIILHLQGAPARPRIEGPTTGETGVELDFTLKAVDEDAVPTAQARGYDYHIDWGNNGKIDTVLTGRADGVAAVGSFSRSGTFTIRLLVKDRTYGTEVAITREITITGEDLEETTARRSTIRRPEENPCSGRVSLSQQLCLMDLRRRGADFSGEHLRSRDVRSRRLQQNTGLRINRLQNRLQRNIREENVLYIPLNTRAGLTDPRRSHLRLDRVEQGRNILQRTTQLKSFRETPQAQLRTRARAGNRTTASRMICRLARSSYRKIACLLQYNVEINERTVDEETLDIWRNMQDE